jgi:hypothetical protein
MLDEFLILPLSFHTNVAPQLLSIPEPASLIIGVGTDGSKQRLANQGDRNTKQALKIVKRVKFPFQKRKRNAFPLQVQGVTRSQRAKHTVSSERSSQDASSDALVTKEQRSGLSNKVLKLKYYFDNHSTMMYNSTTR